MAVVATIFAVLAGLSSLAAPTIFAPGTISGPAHESCVAFAPDGRSFLFGRSTNAAAMILAATKTRGGWSTPTVAPFSGVWLDMEPAMSPDGRYAIFASNRPTSPGGAPVDGDPSQGPDRGKGANLWRVDRTARGWGEPVRLPDAINASGSTYSPSIARDGTLYYMHPNATTHRFQIFSAERTEAGYGTPNPISFSDGSRTDVDPAVASDRSFLVFGSSRHPKTDIDLFIVFRTAAGWGAPEYLGDAVNGPSSDAEPRLAPDGSTLYYSSDRVVPIPEPIASRDRARVLEAMSWNNGLYNIWTVDLAPVLAAHARASADVTMDSLGVASRGRPRRQRAEEVRAARIRAPSTRCRSHRTSPNSY